MCVNASVYKQHNLLCIFICVYFDLYERQLYDCVLNVRRNI